MASHHVRLNRPPEGSEFAGVDMAFLYTVVIFKLLEEMFTAGPRCANFFYLPAGDVDRSAGMPDLPVELHVRQSARGHYCVPILQRCCSATLQTAASRSLSFEGMRETVGKLLTAGAAGLSL